MKKKTNTICSAQTIKAMIHQIRGQNVMLDSDLAKFFGYTTKAFNQQIKNNKTKFSNGLFFRLKKEEAQDLFCPVGLEPKVKRSRGSNLKFSPFAFTERGVYALMTVLKGDCVAKQSEAIITAFQSLKKPPGEMRASQKGKSLIGNYKTSNIQDDVSLIIEDSRNAAIRLINLSLLRRNYLIGKRINEEIISSRAEDYGKKLINNLSLFLSKKYGSGGFDSSALYSYVRFYRLFPNFFDSAGSGAYLSWTHYRVLLSVKNDVARLYYEREALASGWNVRNLQRAIHSQTYERLLSTQSGALPELPSGNAPPQNILEYVKNPMVTEFLGLPDAERFDESDLEQAIIDHLAQFLLEMGRGFAYVGRQHRIHTEKADYYVDLVFYNINLRCYVLIDLKVSKITPQDVGQMDMYVHMFDDIKRHEGDNPTIGILLCAETDEDVAKYSILKGSEQIFAAKYKTYLPDETELRNEIQRQKALFLLAQKKKEEEK